MTFYYRVSFVRVRFFLVTVNDGDGFCLFGRFFLLVLLVVEIRLRVC